MGLRLLSVSDFQYQERVQREVIEEALMLAAQALENVDMNPQVC